MSQQTCKSELEENNLIPRKYYGQVFTTDEYVINKLIETIKSVYKPGTKIVEIGGGLGYITEKLAENFDDIDVLEIDEDLFTILNTKFEQQPNINLIKGDALNYNSPEKPYLFVGNIPFHISGKLYRKFMSEVKHKPYGMVFITDKNYAKTLMGKPPKCYRVSLQAQSYGDIEIISEVPPTSVYPEPKVISCIMKIIQNDTIVPNNFWEVVNHHFENFPTPEIESPKTVGLKGWIELCTKNQSN